jgi:hypothetical protein
MIKKLLVTLIFILSAYIGIGQILKGRLIDTLGNEVTYAHIYLTEEKIGTYSNEKGEFQISFGFDNPKDTLVISHINFVTIKIIINDLSDEKKQEYTLKEKVNLLQTIIIQPLSAREVYNKIISTAANQLKKQANFEYFKIYRAALDNDLAFEQRSKIYISVSQSDQISTKSDSILSMTVYDRKSTSSLGSLNITVGSDKDALNSLLCYKLLFEGGLNNGFLKLVLSSDTISFKNDTLWIYEEEHDLGYIAFDASTYLPIEIQYDLAKSAKLKENILSTKLLFRMVTKRGLRDVNQISFTQRYRHDNDIIIPEFFRFQSEFLTKKHGQEEIINFEKIYYPTHIVIDKEHKISIGADLY